MNPKLHKVLATDLRDRLCWIFEPSPLVMYESERVAGCSECFVRLTKAITDSKKAAGVPNNVSPSCHQAGKGLQDPNESLRNK